jgi:hypothetical protein
VHAVSASLSSRRSGQLLRSARLYAATKREEQFEGVGTRGGLVGTDPQPRSPVDEGRVLGGDRVSPGAVRNGARAGSDVFSLVSGGVVAARSLQVLGGVCDGQVKHDPESVRRDGRVTPTTPTTPTPLSRLCSFSVSFSFSF